jgi:putative membrane protein
MATHPTHASREPRRRWIAFFFSPRYTTWLFGLFVGWFGIWAIRPPHPSDFVLEHILTVVTLIVLVTTHRRFRLSHLSYTFIFAFTCLHVVGAHYTYAEVPYRDWLESLAGWVGAAEGSVKSWLPERNHYDRLVHFAFGLFLAYPAREIFVRVARTRGFWSYYFPLDVVMSFSMLYEIVEWAIVLVVAPELGQSYLGTQGDEWDAHKDMALATLGGFVTLSITAFINWRLHPGFSAEIRESLVAADPKPLGEVRLAELLDSATKPESRSAELERESKDAPDDPGDRSAGRGPTR